MVFRKYHQQRFIRVYRPAGKELAQRMMERHSDVSRTACLRNRMLYLPIKTRSMRVCPRGGIRFMFLVPTLLYSCNSPYSCSLKNAPPCSLRYPCEYPYSRRICPKNATGFVAQRSRLHWHMKQASLPNEASFIFSGYFLDMIISVGFRVNSHQGGFLQVIGRS